MADKTITIDIVANLIGNKKSGGFAASLSNESTNSFADNVAKKRKKTDIEKKNEVEKMSKLTVGSIITDVIFSIPGMLNILKNAMIILVPAVLTGIPLLAALFKTGLGGSTSTEDQLKLLATGLEDTNAKMEATTPITSPGTSVKLDDNNVVFDTGGNPMSGQAQPYNPDTATGNSSKQPEESSKGISDAQIKEWFTGILDPKGDLATNLKNGMPLTLDDWRYIWTGEKSQPMSYGVGYGPGSSGGSSSLTLPSSITNGTSSITKGPKTPFSAPEPGISSGVSESSNKSGGTSEDVSLKATLDASQAMESAKTLSEIDLTVPVNKYWTNMSEKITSEKSAIDGLRTDTYTKFADQLDIVIKKLNTIHNLKNEYDNIKDSGSGSSGSTPAPAAQPNYSTTNTTLASSHVPVSSNIKQMFNGMLVTGSQQSIAPSVGTYGYSQMTSMDPQNK